MTLGPFFLYSSLKVHHECIHPSFPFTRAQFSNQMLLFSPRLLGRIVLCLFALDALPVLLRVKHSNQAARSSSPDCSRNSEASVQRLRGGATTGQAILLTSGSLVTLSGARLVVDGQTKGSEQARARFCHLPCSVLVGRTAACDLRSRRCGYLPNPTIPTRARRTHHSSLVPRRSARPRRGWGSRSSAGARPSSHRWPQARRLSTAD